MTSNNYCRIYKHVFVLIIMNNDHTINLHPAHIHISFRYLQFGRSYAFYRINTNRTRLSFGTHYISEAWRQALRM